jgi:hypothetical protein
MDHDLKEIEQRFREHERQQIAALRRPKFTAKVLDRVDVTESTRTNWLNRGFFDLDADRHREGNEARLYSARDALLLSCAVHWAALGVPISAAAACGNHILDKIARLLRPRSSIGGTTMMIFPRGDEWIIADKPFDDRAPLVADVIGANGKVRSERIARENAPATYLAFEPERFFADMMEKLGEPILIGTAADHRRQAAKSGR